MFSVCCSLVTITYWTCRTASNITESDIVNQNYNKRTAFSVVRRINNNFLLLFDYNVCAGNSIKINFPFSPNF